MAQRVSCAQCNNAIPPGQQYFADISGNPACSQCHERTKRPCAGCNNAILPSVRVSRKWNGKEYHTDCFRCAACLKTMKDPIQDAGKLYCESCGRKCTKCNQILKNVKWMEFDDKFYHDECWACSKCNTALGEEEVYLIDEKPVCANCAGA